MIERQELTGQTRGRPNLFGRKLTMQVEVQILEANAFLAMRAPPMPNCTDFEAWKQHEDKRIAAQWQPTRTIWRDATWVDQMALFERHNAGAKRSPTAPPN